MEKRAVIILAEGFEEVEAITPMDVLRRSGIATTMAGLGSNTITGAHGMIIKTDVVFEKYDSLFDAIIFPGGMPGAENLAKSDTVKEAILEMNSKKKIIAAICASPALVLAPLGILDGKKATCFPGMEKNFSTNVKFAKDKVVQDGNIITSRGAGTASLFGLSIVANLIGKETAEMIGKQMLFID
jgi:4-methyl-5(b-hydroxyethyl)-thiazole monophosphate biosynthesis